MSKLYSLALFLVCANLISCQYLQYAKASAKVLQSWYNPTKGGFDSTGWWNSANAFNAIIDYSKYSNDSEFLAELPKVFDIHKAGKFLNEYYDDEGWWTLTWINAYDETKRQDYLNMAEIIFKDMTTGWDNNCKGGIWWNKAHTYKNAIPNELFLSIATKLYIRTKNSVYLNWADKEWKWFFETGLINEQNLVNDGLDHNCKNNKNTAWTYNQGVILSGLVDLHLIKKNDTYLLIAEKIALATIKTLVDNQKILKEHCEPKCGVDGCQFKGIFMRNLLYLYHVDKRENFKNFIIENVNSIWTKSRASNNKIGLSWDGPIEAADACTQSSAQDALNSALRI